MSGSKQRGNRGESGVKAARNVYLIALARRGRSGGAALHQRHTTQMWKSMLHSIIVLLETHMITGRRNSRDSPLLCTVKMFKASDHRFCLHKYLDPSAVFSRCTSLVPLTLFWEIQKTLLTVFSSPKEIICDDSRDLSKDVDSLLFDEDEDQYDHAENITSSV